MNKKQQQLEDQRLQKERIESIKYYEEFINDTLQVDLERVIGEREKIMENLENYLELKSNIELIEENKMESMKTMINLGSECYAKARVPDTKYIYVNIGLGVHVRYTLKEALNFIDEKESFLNTRIETLTKRINQVKTKIDLVQKGIQDLKSLDEISAPM
ncbi:hypothetical protein DICPUDRAFT_83203 [Dictyostelium purpureum]|uniref:Prefoldin alpha subunit family protein n=1 Tax=Dictyostelium purpureum TaxID=5786 RepID=F0ZYU9_DICPU|nr:uncharacterized protein DICPUDRAFT_83203 [Dictyostelium purpureum]EGC30884.1 hypothetical protein DICPUDRAFT_83203 [Dictyostelium purpureum]|eukprot:XP_003292589.1 hypothetical protein DICPUDRAFT_83203 [Dictyostelium purpureum]